MPRKDRHRKTIRHIGDFGKGRKKIQDEEILEDIKRVLNITNGDTRIQTYRDKGNFSSNTVVRHFEGSWLNALSAVGIKIGATQTLFGSREVPRQKRAKPDEPFDPQVQMRQCLGPNCGRMFKSQWAGNRICVACKESDNYRFPSGEMYSMKIVGSSYKSNGASDVSGY
jgi:hypothetical protein